VGKKKTKTGTAEDFEKLSAFYLGKLYSLKRRETQPELLLYDSKDLTTHAVCVGMTGSGKTGLCLALLEEAAIDGIPAIAIDPKGDLGNLLLTFPGLNPADFCPWIDPSEATRQGLTPEQLAAKTADVWRQGLAAWGQDGTRIDKFRSSVDMAIYTPGSSAGMPISVLRSLQAPPSGVIDDSDAFRERIAAAVSGLLALMGIAADPLQSREHILLASILDRAWREPHDLDFATLLHQIQSPPFSKVGFIELESFFPAKERFELALRLNNLLASPGFSTWSEGEPLDVGRLLYTPEGRPRLSVLSIAHLAEAERMFFVTLVLNEVVSWMRSQPGTSSLRALIYMDEVFGYFPPVANPPSKQPMLTLLKQARAYGLGVVLATQNPVDLDYKGLSNAGTWFLGRLQTERDKHRVLEGLEGASVTAGKTFDRGRMEETLAALGNRVFLMNNVHEDEPAVFQTRWALSYLRGPLSREQIRTLMDERRSSLASQIPARQTGSSVVAALPAAARTAAPRPVLPPDIPEAFWPIGEPVFGDETVLYRPALLGSGRLHFVSTKAKVDLWEDVTIVAPLGDDVPQDVWEEGEAVAGTVPRLQEAPETDAKFSSLPDEATSPKKYSSWKTALKNHLYRHRTLPLWKCDPLERFSSPGETRGEFSIRLRQVAHERRDLELARLQQRYAPKLASLKERIRKAERRIAEEKSQYQQQQWDTAVSFGTTLLGALFGRKLTSATTRRRAASAARSAGRSRRQRDDVARAEDAVHALTDSLEELEAAFQDEVRGLRERMEIAEKDIDEFLIRPRKSDITVSQVTLVWMPWLVDKTGVAKPAS
jgi:hypothetical protein